VAEAVGDGAGVQPGERVYAVLFPAGGGCGIWIRSATQVVVRVREACSRTASHPTRELVAVQAVPYQECSVSVQVDRVLELFICRLDNFLPNASSGENSKELLLRDSA
jgi:hypothetical protein